MTHAVTHNIKSLGEFKKCAQAFASTLKIGDVVGLSGPLGSGKTTFIQSVAKKLGVASAVTSPTFVVFKLYQYAGSNGLAQWLCHVDAYRLDRQEEAVGFEEYCGNDGAICMIEWPENILHIDQYITHKISIEVQKNNARIVRITKMP